MKIVFLTHPDFLNHQSMPRFTKMLATGMENRGHDIEIWKPIPKFFKISNNIFLSKWLGYIDQYIVFPKEIRRKIDKSDPDTLYVLTDQALGLWVPLIKNRAHVVHCHDFLAQFSALGYIQQNPISATGKLYQKFIRQGYSKAKNFISVSEKTARDLSLFLSDEPKLSKVVYNGLNQSITTEKTEYKRQILSEKTGINLRNGFILHVGGNQWYKNRLGVIDIYNSWCNITQNQLPLFLIGEKPSTDLLQKYHASQYKKNIFFADNFSDEDVRAAYCSASIMLFPSISEGFGWPIAEAMASGCIVITTNAAPMTEVAGKAGFFIPVIPDDIVEIPLWANDAAKEVEYVLNLSAEERIKAIEAGIGNASRFETENALNEIEKIYIKILQSTPYHK